MQIFIRTTDTQHIIDWPGDEDDFYGMIVDSDYPFIDVCEIVPGGYPKRTLINTRHVILARPCEE